MNRLELINIYSGTKIPSNQYTQWFFTKGCFRAERPSLSDIYAWQQKVNNAHWNQGLHTCYSLIYAKQLSIQINYNAPQCIGWKQRERGLLHICNLKKMSAKSPNRKVVASDVTHVIGLLWTCCCHAIEVEGHVIDWLAMTLKLIACRLQAKPVSKRDLHTEKYIYTHSHTGRCCPPCSLTKR